MATGGRGSPRNPGETQGKAIAARSGRVRDNNEKQCRNNESNAGTPVASVLPWAHEKTRCDVPPGRRV
jgi:hypothetical protein